MTLLVTGAQGFVMSNLVRAWLRRHPSERVVALDFAPPDTLARRWFSAEADRITWLQADILAREAWFGPARDAGVDLIVHGAAVTPHAWVDEAGVRHGPEREQPERVLDVNLGGTRAALELARTLPDFRRFVLVSTGSVYGDEGPTDRPLPEVGYVDPTTLYGISKYARPKWSPAATASCSVSVWWPHACLRSTDPWTAFCRRATSSAHPTVSRGWHWPAPPSG